MKLLRKLLVEKGTCELSTSFQVLIILALCYRPATRRAPRSSVCGLKLRNTSPYSSLSDESGAKSGSSDHLWYSPAWREQLAFGCSTEHCFMLQSFSKLFDALYPFISFFMYIVLIYLYLFYTPTGSSRVWWNCQ